MFLAIGALFLLMGLVCGGAILAIPLGLIHNPHSLTIYVLFPLLSVLGYLFMLGGVKTAAAGTITRLAGLALFLLAAAAAVVLVLFATGILGQEGMTLPVWYVMILGLIFGPAAFSVRSRTLAEQS